MASRKCHLNRSFCNHRVIIRGSKWKFLCRPFFFHTSAHYCYIKVFSEAILWHMYRGRNRRKNWQFVSSWIFVVDKVEKQAIQTGSLRFFLPNRFCVLLWTTSEGIYNGKSSRLKHVTRSKEKIVICYIVRDFITR